jgi:hypothetical protein
MTLLSRSVNLLNRDRKITVRYVPPSGQPFDWEVIAGGQVGGEAIDETGEVIKVVRLALIGRSADLIANAVTKIQPYAKVEVDGVEWSVDTNDTRWGEPLVRLGLARETLVRDWQAHGNAAV